MNKFKPGDRVRLSDQAEYQRRAILGGAHGTVLHDTDPTGGVLVDWDGHNDMWNYPRPHEIELVVPQYDEATKDAIVALLRENGHIVIPSAVEEAWAELTAPKTQKVVVEFEVDATFDLVAVLTDLEDAHEGIRFVDVKEDN